MKFKLPGLLISVSPGVYRYWQNLPEPSSSWTGWVLSVSLCVRDAQDPYGLLNPAEDLFQWTNRKSSFIVLGRPEQDFGCWGERKGHLPGPAGNMPLTAAEDRVGIFATRPLKGWCSRTSRCFPSGQLQPVLVPGVVPSQMQDCTPLLEQLELPLSPFYPPIQAPLEGRWTLCCISFSSLRRVHHVLARRCWTVLDSVCFQLYFVLLIAPPWLLAIPAVFSPHPCPSPPACSLSSSAGTCQRAALGRAHCPAQAWERSQQGSRAAPCSALRACAQGRALISALCIALVFPPARAPACQPYLLSHYFWCNALTAQLTSLSTDTFAPYIQTECLPFTLVEKERQYYELELRDSNSIEMQLWKKGFVTVFQSCQMIWLSHTLKVWYTEIFAWCVLSGKCLDIWLHSYMF